MKSEDERLLSYLHVQYMEALNVYILNVLRSGIRYYFVFDIYNSFVYATIIVLDNFWPVRAPLMILANQANKYERRWLFFAFGLAWLQRNINSS